MIRLPHEQHSLSDRFIAHIRKLGFIEYNGGLTVHDSLLSIVLRDEPASDR